jgi:hypothetical protein
MSRAPVERCDFCGRAAVAYQHGSRVCGACGVARTLNSGTRSLRSRRAALIGLLSSGLLIRIMIGSIAVAAVGGWAASTSRVPDSLPVVSSTIGADPTTQTSQAIQEPAEPTVDDILDTAREQAEHAQGLADASRAWADCVSRWARMHSGERFDPREVCGERPDPSDFGIGKPPAEGETTRAERGAGANEPKGRSDKEERSSVPRGDSGNAGRGSPDEHEQDG